MYAELKRKEEKEAPPLYLDEQALNVEDSFAEERPALWEIQMMGVMYSKSSSLL
ncbi:hypothetical protein L2D08_18805 [Domibacillus sp. PGB-M46]|uniref:hypothetical protein n=1 Tax=Domibacillus sp. PGB-M46 TaxID=2910255 RepID=UPI001F57FC73|nr:hypothetical protein [Domibacillus sp. PGB-M46]MCI2256396.1 hypothetical protein [Domibacillus sp. PGB-M46]